MDKGDRAYNFSAGPAAIPTAVLEKAQTEFLNWNSQGCSVMEFGHRTPEFQELIDKTENDFRELLKIPEQYKVLFMHGSASHQFSMVPMNFLAPNDSANYLEQAHWSKKAIKEAKRFAKIHVQQAFEETDAGLSIVPESQWRLDEKAKYLHFTSNETIVGVQFQQEPAAFNGHLVCDMCSDILSRPVDIEKYALIYAGAQKNIGPSGMTMVIVREDLFEQMQTERVPTLFQYPLMAEHGSLYNTPPSYGIYLASLVFEWLKDLGGIAAVEKLNIEKSKLLYSYIDQSDFYHSPVAVNSRSVMNVAFTLADPKLDQLFLSQAQQQGLLALKGHRDFGGMRASIYNAMSIEGIKALIDFMKKFEQKS
ncbi:3-phosphoserine/phosphohydroxythreonine transaminase [Kangiella sp. HZ709]|uniref:3-phosphoserine/phosphohydroxythreonine transaminase n=1 Tax=Kangiella sp. HZ709 TaxID=2666328 RepID=UPI0012AFBD50|nr:3-phosphoserine/phosphohydroxythreonine transaminase [Kangiella sp. HZ709]